MGKVITGFTMSLDGFIAGPNDDIRRLFTWFSSGDTPFPVPGTDMVFRISRASADHIGELWGSIGALVTGRRDFDVSGAWGGKPPVRLACVYRDPPPAARMGQAGLTIHVHH